LDKSILHGTPAIVTRNEDQLQYPVYYLYYSGDRRGLCVLILVERVLVELTPGEYRTHGMFFGTKTTRH